MVQPDEPQAIKPHPSTEYRGNCHVYSTYRSRRPLNDGLALEFVWRVPNVDWSNDDLYIRVGSLVRLIT